MSSSQDLNKRLADLATKIATVEKSRGEAERKKAAKDAEAASYTGRAQTTSSDSTRKSYLRSATSAQTAALREGKAVAAFSVKRATLAKEQASLNSSLNDALKRETAAAKTQADKDRRAQEAAASRAKRDRESDERRAAQKRRQERQEDERRTSALVGQVDHRLTARLDAIAPPKREQLRILYATASADGGLRVDEEIRRVRAVVKASTHRDQVVIEHLPAATAGDLLDGLTSFRPHVVHFSGHADEQVLEFDNGADTHGPGHRVTARAFKSAIEAPDQPPTLVVLNACDSTEQARELLGKVPLAIGMSASVGDNDALTFATRFYRSLAEGQSVAAALATARADMEMNGLEDYHLPELHALDGLDPSDIRLVIGP